MLDVTIDGAKGALIHVCGGNDMTLAEANSVAQRIYDRMDINDSMVIWGARVSDEFNGYLRVMLLITGITSPQIFGKVPSNDPLSYESKIPKSKIGLGDDIFDIGEITFE